LGVFSGISGGTLRVSQLLTESSAQPNATWLSGANVNPGQKTPFGVIWSRDVQVSRYWLPIITEPR